jgi:hypothetical protein
MDVNYLNRIKFEKHLTELIITQAQALYGNKYEIGYIWSVVTSLKDDKFTAHVLVYEKRQTITDGKTLMSGGKEKTVDRALESLLMGLREALGRMIG